MTGSLIAFVGLDQSGKQTQAERLRDRLVAAGRTVRLLDFPSYETHIGGEIGRALKGERDYAADTMQLLYVANRFEWKPEIERELAAGTVVLCDRYLASSTAKRRPSGFCLVSTTRESRAPERPTMARPGSSTTGRPQRRSAGSTAAAYSDGAIIGWPS